MHFTLDFFFWQTFKRFASHRDGNPAMVEHFFPPMQPDTRRMIQQHSSLSVRHLKFFHVPFKRVLPKQAAHQLCLQTWDQSNKPNHVTCCVPASLPDFSFPGLSLLSFHFPEYPNNQHTLNHENASRNDAAI